MVPEEEVVQGPECRTEESLRWAEDDAARFETTKIEAILLSRRRGHSQARRTWAVRVDGREVPFAREVTRWLCKMMRFRLVYSRVCQDAASYCI